MPDPLLHACRQLRLSGLASSLELRLHEAAAHGIAHRQFLELLFQDELNVRNQRSLERRKKLAQFPDLQPLENFDWQFNPQINRAHILMF
jgi:DNA replication protein DnaC